MFGTIFLTLRRIAAGNRWLVIAFAALAGLWALEYLAHGAIGVMRDLATLKPTIEQRNAESCAARGKAFTELKVTSPAGWADKSAPEYKKWLEECGGYLGGDINETPVKTGALIAARARKYKREIGRKDFC
jgi:hypothetical protein